MGKADFRWHLADDGQDALFERTRRVTGKGEFRNLTFWEVEARSIINPVPHAANLPFRYTINPYRGCSHACAYCLVGDTKILMADGSTKLLADVEVGDQLIGTEVIGRYRRYTTSLVTDRWTTVKTAYRVSLDDDTALTASGDHRLLTTRGWKHVTGATSGRARRPHLTENSQLLGPGPVTGVSPETADYRLGYLTGMIRGDGHVGSYAHARPGRVGLVHGFRLALVDNDALDRTQSYLERLGIPTDLFAFASSGLPMSAIRTSRESAVHEIDLLRRWPERPTSEWRRGFLAGVFDAEGSFSRGIIRISNSDEEIHRYVEEALVFFGFAPVRDVRAANGVSSVRFRGGLKENLRFVQLVDPAIGRKRGIAGYAVKNSPGRRVAAVEALGVKMPMYDLTTTTGDFIAEGVISHNCFARPTHEFLGFDVGSDFDSQIVVKVNAVELTRAETRPGRWRGEHIAMGTNTDPYQRAEGKYRLTRGIVEALLERGNPFSVLTKSTLALRDLDLFVEAASSLPIRVDFSIPTLDEAVWRETEPGTPHPRQRVEAVRRLNEAGVPSGVLMAPLLPGISDAPEQVDEVVRACEEAGARFVSPMLLHLKPGVKEHYMAWLAERHPDLVARYEELYRGRAYLERRRPSPRRPPSTPTDEDRAPEPTQLHLL